MISKKKRENSRRNRANGRSHENTGRSGSPSLRRTTIDVRRRGNDDPIHSRSHFLSFLLYSKTQSIEDDDRAIKVEREEPKSIISMLRDSDKCEGFNETTTKLWA